MRLLPCGTSTAAIFLVAISAIGCQMFGSRVIESPLSYSDQKSEILAIIPIGTSRDEAVRLSKEAGIEGTFGVAQSMYYCDLWNRPNGTRWHIDLALLFDESGNLYQVRPGGSATGILPASSANAVSQPTSSSVRQSSPGAPTDGEITGGRRDSERTPFADAAAFGR